MLYSCTMDSLTGLQQKVYDYICSYALRHGSSPTLREISGHINTKGTASAICHLTALKKKGYVQLESGKARGIVIIEEKTTQKHQSDIDTSIQVPIVGRVRAGYPTPPIEDIESYISTDPLWLRGNGCFFLRVSGNSMQEGHILDGDLALIRPQVTAENWDIVVAVVNNEATLKEFHMEKNHIRLQPKNSNMEPIIVLPEDGEVSIVGKVVGVFRRMS
jgi:repressor LexA